MLLVYAACVVAHALTLNCHDLLLLRRLFLLLVPRTAGCAPGAHVGGRPRLQANDEGRPRLQRVPAAEGKGKPVATKHNSSNSSRVMLDVVACNRSGPLRPSAGAELFFTRCCHPLQQQAAMYARKQDTRRISQCRCSVRPSFRSTQHAPSVR